MPVENLYPIVKRAYRTKISGLESYEPRAHDSLFDFYNFKNRKKRSMNVPLNDAFDDVGRPIVPGLTRDDTGEFDTVHDVSKFLFNKRFNKNFPPVVVALALLASLAMPDLSWAAIKLQEINRDNNPDVVSYEERRIYFANQATINVNEIDGNKDGKIDKNELKKLNKLIDKEVRRNMVNLFPGDLSGGEPTREGFELRVALDRVDEELIVPPTPEELERARELEERRKKQKYQLNGDKFYLRRTGRDITTWSGNIAPEAASITYDYDGVSGVNKGKIVAAVGYLRKYKLNEIYADKAKPPFLNAFSLGGSVAINRSFDSRGSKFETDSLNFRAGGDLEFAFPDGSAHNLTNWLRYETDTEFDRQVVGIETIYEPYYLSFSPAKKFANGLVVGADFIPTIESDYAYVIADPGSVVPFDEYWNLGFGLRLEVDFRRKGKLLATFSSDYEHFWNVAGNGEVTYNWVNQFQIPLSANNNASLLVSYVNSDSDLTSSSTNELSVGLGLKY